MVKTKGGLCYAGQLRLFIIIAPFFCRISLTVILMRKKWKKMQFFMFFFPQLVGCDFQVEHREKNKIKRRIFFWQRKCVFVNVECLNRDNFECCAAGEVKGEETRGWLTCGRGESSPLVWECGSGGDLSVQIINGLVNHGHRARNVSRVVSI